MDVNIGDYGQPRLERLLVDMLARGRLGGSLLFEGPTGAGKEALAIEVGRLLNCENDGRCAPRPPFQRSPEPAKAPRCASCHKFDRLQHPDLHLHFPVPRDTWQDETAEIQKILNQKAQDPYFKPEFDRPTLIQAEILSEIVLPAVARRPVEGRLKVVILSDADQVAHDQGNRVLKTLEEPPADCLLVLTTAVPERLLPTILSRCQRLHCAPLAADWIETRLQRGHDAKPAPARLAASLAQGSMLAAARFLGGDFQNLRERAFEVLNAAGNCDLMRLLELSETTARESSKRRHLPAALLRLLALVARDALLVAEGAAEAAVRREAAPGSGARRAAAPAAADGTAGASSAALVNADRAAEVGALAAAHAPEALRAAIRAAESAERQIAGYVHIEMTFAALFLGLARRSVKGRALTAGRPGLSRRA